jgi:hypothetical protein
MSVLEKTKETWSEAEVHRITVKIVLLSMKRSVKTEAHFERALEIARAQAKIVGVARRSEHGAALARSGQAGRGPQPSRSRSTAGSGKVLIPAI